MLLRRLHLPLYAQILVWLFLNLLVLGLVAYAFLRVQFRFGLDTLLMGRTGERIQAVTDLLIVELAESPTPDWTRILQRFGDAYQVECYLFRWDGGQEAGEPVVLPPTVRERIVQMPAAAEPAHRGPPGGGGRGLGPGPALRRGLGRLLHPKFIVRSTDPVRYWVGVRFPAPGTARPRAGPLTLLLASSSLAGGGLFVDLTPWLLVGGGAILFSILFWLPMVRGITRTVSQMTHATGRIAEGHFDVRVEAARRDELGTLASAVNRMAARLDGFVRGQKRFLGDVAHELCSPLARIQMALGVLEQRAEADQQVYVNDVREEVGQMSALVNELLSFSRASLGDPRLKLRPVPLAATARKAVEREDSVGAAVIELEIDEAWQVLAEPELLLRALANLVRNAVRYAGQAGPITLRANPSPGRVHLRVIDSGPGVPEADLERVFDPFYRIESSRSRETGGIGLGLAIVKTCIEACGGQVQARNRVPHGLEVEIVLDQAVGSPAPA